MTKPRLGRRKTRPRVATERIRKPAEAAEELRVCERQFRNLLKQAEALRVFRDGKRWISRATSSDFIHWSDPIDLELDGKPRQHLYTNQIDPYSRAPHIYLGLPTRFFPGEMATGCP